MKELTSSSNDLFRQFKSLTDSKGIKKHSQSLVSGPKITCEFLTQHPQLVLYILVFDPDQLIELKHMVKNHMTPVLLDKELFNSLDTIGTHKPILVVKTPTLEVCDLNIPPKGLCLLTAMSDPNNLGALIRSAAAFGVTHITLLHEACHPFHPRVTRAACGANFNLLLNKGPSIKDLHCEIYALDLDGTPINDIQWPKNLRLLIGEEGQGVPKILDVKKITIPISSQVESLNAMTSAAIALHSWSSGCR